MDPSINRLAKEAHAKLRRLREGREKIELDGHHLDVATVVAVANFGILPAISKNEPIKERMEASVKVLEDFLGKGWTVYGVNTGFGGSADTRTQELWTLQVSLLQHLQSAIIPQHEKLLAGNADRMSTHTVPRPWVKAAILVRANQNLRGHSAVRMSVIDRMLDLINKDITPLVPLRGTISASGDLMPLSYIAGALTGNPDVFVQLGEASGHKIVPSSDALKQVGFEPLVLGPKEGLGIVNGTSPSAALASMVIFEAQQLAILAQALTAFTAECLAGNVEWVNEFVHATRPHPGQLEAARNIRNFLSSSQLVTGLTPGSRKRQGDGLWQDRYSTRTAAQWIGPYLEDLALAHQQIQVELNATCDNPIVQAGSEAPDMNDIFSGGNFQATAITSAMDKTRLALVMIGRMLFSQVSEMINPAHNNGLTPNLNFGEDDAFTMKGVDVNTTAYMSELAALAHPASAHVFSAEMHNQGINSLAFISARKTMEAVDLLAHICACHTYVSCQAVEIREQQERDLVQVVEGMSKILTSSLGLPDGPASHEVNDMVKAHLPRLWYGANSAPSNERLRVVVDSLMPKIMEVTHKHGYRMCSSRVLTIRKELTRAPIRLRPDQPRTGPSSVQKEDYWAADDSSIDSDLMELDEGLVAREPNKTDKQDAQTPKTYMDNVIETIGAGSSRIYRHVRSRMGVPSHMGLSDDPLAQTSRSGTSSDGPRSRETSRDIVHHLSFRTPLESLNRAHGETKGAAQDTGRPKKTIGSWVSIIYDGIRDGSLVDSLIDLID